MNKIINYILGIFTVYRLAYLIAKENGPGFIFKRFRNIANEMALEEVDETGKQGLWSSIDEGINCQFCVGFYMSLLVTILLKKDNFVTRFILLLFGLWGIQLWLERH